MFLLSFSLKHFLISFRISILTHGLSRDILADLQTYEDFPVTFVFISSLISLLLENTLWIISIL